MRRLVAKSSCVQKVLRKTKVRNLRTNNQTGSPHSFYRRIVEGGFQEGRVCIVRSVGGIGDVLMITPAIRQLRKDFPKLDITFAVDRHCTGVQDTYWSLVNNLDFIDHVIDARFVKQEAYNVVTDISAVCIRYERRGLPPINRIDLFAKSMGIPRVVDKLPAYQVEVEEVLWAKKLLQDFKAQGKYLIGLNIASFDPKRSWSAVQAADLITTASKNNPNIHFLIFDFNRALALKKLNSNCTDFSTTTVREMAALIQQCDLFIGPDSGPMHIAACVKTRTLALFGCIPPEARINYYPTHTALVANIPCLGCWYIKCNVKLKCMKDLTASMVYNKVLDYAQEDF